MWWCGYLLLLFHLLLEGIRRRPLGEEKQYRETTWLLGAAKTSMILWPTLILVHRGEETDGWMFGVGIPVGLLGLWVRGCAMRKMGRLFSRHLGIQEGHRMIREGWYRRVRHPGYLGTLLTYAGFALTTGSWVALCGNLLIFFAAYSYRIRMEEKMLLTVFGEGYRTYQAQTWRLLPFIY